MTNGAGSSSEMDHPRIFGASALVSAVLTAALLGDLVQPTPSIPPGNWCTWQPIGRFWRCRRC